MNQYIDGVCIFSAGSLSTTFLLLLIYETLYSRLLLDTNKMRLQVMESLRLFHRLQPLRCSEHLLGLEFQFRL